MTYNVFGGTLNIAQLNSLPSSDPSWLLKLLPIGPSCVRHPRFASGLKRPNFRYIIRISKGCKVHSNGGFK